VNPVVYFFVNPSFQHNLLRTLRCRCSMAHPGGGVQGVGVWRVAAPGCTRRDSSGGCVETEMLRGVNGGSTAVTTSSVRSTELHSSFV